MKIEYTNLTILSDWDLNKLIGDLLSLAVEERTKGTEMLGFASASEWRRRHPGTIPPVTFELAEKSGGFPVCYTGPRETVKITNPSAD